MTAVAAGGMCRQPAGGQRAVGRVWNEDLGDALEAIRAMQRAGVSHLQLWFAIILACYRVMIASVRYYISTK